jgi:hypothetical protein
VTRQQIPRIDLTDSLCSPNDKSVVAPQLDDSGRAASVQDSPRWPSELGKAIRDLKGTPPAGILLKDGHITVEVGERCAAILRSAHAAGRVTDED